MLKSICIQLWNKKRSNGWLAVELLLVFCLIWYITDFFFVLGCNYSIPSYRNLEHTWCVNIAQFPEGHPEYDASDNDPAEVEANFNRLLQVLKNYSGVEAVAVTFNGSAPGRGDYNGQTYINPADTTIEMNGQDVTIGAGTDYYRVFGNTTAEGAKMVSAIDFNLAGPNAIVIGKRVEDRLFPGQSAVGKEIRNTYGQEQYWVVAGVVDDVKRFNYLRPQATFYLSRAITAENVGNAEISVRSSATLSDSKFITSFKEAMISSLRIGNFYLQSIDAYTKIQANTDKAFGMSNAIQLRVYLLLFFLINTLLCVMGTFWYRINLRREEVGIRISIGSTRAGIRNLFLLEGLCILSFVMLPAIILEFQFVYAGLIDTIGRDANSHGNVYLPDRTLLRFLLTNAITWMIMALVILVAIWTPASRAAALAPATALRYE